MRAFVYVLRCVYGVRSRRLGAAAGTEMTLFCQARFLNNSHVQQGLIWLISCTVTDLRQVGYVKQITRGVFIILGFNI